MPTQCNTKPLEFEAHGRRVVAKAEALPRGPNPRFVVTSLSARDYPAQKPPQLAVPHRCSHQR